MALMNILEYSSRRGEHGEEEGFFARLVISWILSRAAFSILENNLFSCEKETQFVHENSARAKKNRECVRNEGKMTAREIEIW